MMRSSLNGYRVGAEQKLSPAWSEYRQGEPS